MEKIDLQLEDELYLLGDYIDRGPNSKGVIDTIFKLKKEGYKVTCLMGNHEDAMIKSKTDRSMWQNWLAWGGKETLESFGVYDLNNISQQYWDFLENLDYYAEVDDYILVHAGLNFDAGDPLEDRYSLLWIRRWYRDINKEWLGNRKIIHGHTPIGRKEMEGFAKVINHVQYLDIDAGCYCYDWLSAFELTEQELIFQKRIDEVMYSYY